MIKHRFNINGAIQVVTTPSPQGYVFHPCVVEPDQSLSIRQIYTRWRQNKPTSVHPFACEFDEDADQIDFEDENPIDICQIPNRVDNLQAELEAQTADSNREKKRKKAEHDAKLKEIKMLADAINQKTD